MKRRNSNLRSGGPRVTSSPRRSYRGKKEGNVEGGRADEMKDLRQLIFWKPVSNWSDNWLFWWNMKDILQCLIFRQMRAAWPEMLPGREWQSQWGMTEVKNQWMIQQLALSPPPGSRPHSPPTKFCHSKSNGDTQYTGSFGNIMTSSYSNVHIRLKIIWELQAWIHRQNPINQIQSNIFAREVFKFKV